MHGAGGYIGMQLQLEGRGGRRSWIGKEELARVGDADGWCGGRLVRVGWGFDRPSSDGATDAAGLRSDPTRSVPFRAWTASQLAPSLEAKH